MVKKTVTKSIKTLVNSALGGVWRNQLLKNSVLRVEGLLGVTLSNKEVLLVHVDELLSDQALLLLQTDDEDSDVAAPVGEPIKARVKSPAKRGRKRKYPQSKKEEIPSVQPTSLVDNFVVLQADSGQPVQNFPLDIYSEANPVLDEATQDDDLDHVDQVISVKEERHDMSYGEPDTGHDDEDLGRDDGLREALAGAGMLQTFLCDENSLRKDQIYNKDETETDESFTEDNSIPVEIADTNLLIIDSVQATPGQTSRLSYHGGKWNSEHIFDPHCKLQKVTAAGEERRRSDPTVCPKCLKVFKTKESLKCHSYICGLVDKIFPCRYCEKRFSSKRYVYEHEKRSHTIKGTYYCESCAKTLRGGKSQALLHMRNVHGAINHGPNQVGCDICDEKFTEISELNQHFDEVHCMRK